ncbi:methyl-accepting chemotaxis protein [Anaerocolumna xylanovorans]|uniref:Methyl-accepting chemotaxis protein n=1 Tax=Anaerocolumna xylanovorans DSM 12503 TaxID=1121345 RepID=A0A1M7Y7J0_9FIRM|nr:methyl-accepting chemotaxis protein [Anaerocolumna xylanovorans]SHO48625.1 methyl-accepting chemotaxis protein [Anaerocolumna xylanovorans DSM 12503]
MTTKKVGNDLMMKRAKEMKASINLKNRRKKPALHSIRLKLTMYFLVPILFILILGITAYLNASKSLIQIFTQANIASFNSMSDYYKVILSNIEDKATQLNNNSDAARLYSGHFTSDVIKELEIYKNVSGTVKKTAITDRYIGTISLLTKYGNSITSKSHFGANQKPYEEFAASEDGIQIDKSDKVSLWSGYHNYIDGALKIDKSDYAFSLTTKFVNDSFKQIGYIIIDVKMNIITDALKSLNLPPNSMVAFISPDGREITPDGKTKEFQFADKSYYKEAITAEKSQGNSYIEFNKSKYLFIYSKVGETGALLCALIPSASLTDKADSIKALTIIIVLIASSIALVMGVLVARGISREIKNIIKKLTLAAEGDLTVNIQTKRKDEFQVLSKSINNMVKNMRVLIMKASEVGNSVIQSADYVNQNSELLLTSSKDISYAITEIQEGISLQAGDTEQCLKQTNELTDKINTVHQNTYAIEEIANATKIEVKDGIEKVDQLNKATRANMIIINETIQEIEELDKESQTITEIVDVMNSIAEQTNLLSLNASIEAARAGIHGRGFSVVADEIGKLAKGSMDASNEIKEIIDNIKKKTARTVVTVKQTETISRTSEESLTNVVALFNNINGHVDNLSVKLDKIMGSISNMEKAKVDTLNSMESISAIAEETSAASEEVDATTQQQLEAVTKLNEAVKILQNNAADLKISIQSFKIGN